MKNEKQSRESFRNAVYDAITADLCRWPQPVIYAKKSDNGEFLFRACNAAALCGDEIVWLHVEPDSFGVLSDNPDADADGIKSNMFEQAINDINDADFMA